MRGKYYLLLQKQEFGMKIIISLTSFPARINAAIKVIEKMMNQTMRPDKIVLYLTSGQFPDKKLPEKLLKLRGDMVDIKFFDKPIKSYTKLIPALIDFPNDIIITVDDDMYYPDNLVEELLRAHKKYPRAICLNRTRRIKFAKDGQPLTYLKWPLYRSFRKFYLTRRPHPMNLVMGVGGVLYPPHCLHPLVTRDDMFMKLSPSADDLWFWVMAAKAGTCIKFVNNNRVKEHQFEDTQESALMYENRTGGNDRAMANILAEFPEVKKLAISS